MRALARQIATTLPAAGMVVGALAGTPAAADLDPTFTPARLNGGVESVVALPNGKVLIGGLFRNVGRDSGTDSVARLNPDGSRDAGFDPPKIRGYVYTVTALPKGQVLIGGEFTNLGGDRRTDYVARLNRDGSRDRTFRPPHFGPSFNPGDLFTAVEAVTRTAGGKYLVGGDFTEVGGIPDLDGIVRLKGNGRLDRSFVPASMNGVVETVVPLESGALIVGGMFSSVGGVRGASRLVRLDSDGALDPTFTPPRLDSEVLNAVALPSGALLVGGYFSDVASDRDLDGLVRLNADGSLDTSFRPPRLDFEVRSIAVTSDGSVVIGGSFRRYVMVLRSDGTPDPTFTPPRINGSVGAVAIVKGAGYLIGGDFTTVDRNRQLAHLARLN